MLEYHGTWEEEIIIDRVTCLSSSMQAGFEDSHRSSDYAAQWLSHLGSSVYDIADHVRSKNFLIPCLTLSPVSYTHLDVYKRQLLEFIENRLSVISLRQQ